MLLLKALGIWFLLAALAIFNGAIRTLFILPAFGEQTAHVIGTLIFLLFQFIVIYFFIRKASITETSELIKIGVFWVIISIIFEFIFGHFVMGHSWEKLFADYNILKARLWSLVLLNNLAAPLITGKYFLPNKVEAS